jgi:hypothetical protein
MKRARPDRSPALPLLGHVLEVGITPIVLRYLPEIYKVVLLTLSHEWNEYINFTSQILPFKLQIQLLWLRSVQNGDLALLKWMKESKFIQNISQGNLLQAPDADTFDWLSSQGGYEGLRRREYNGSAVTCLEKAFELGSMGMAQWHYNNVYNRDYFYLLSDMQALRTAILYNRTAIISWIINQIPENSNVKLQSELVVSAANHSKLHILTILKNRGFSIDSVCRIAAINKNMDLLKWAHRNSCRFDDPTYLSPEMRLCFVFYLLTYGDYSSLEWIMDSCGTSVVLNNEVYVLALCPFNRRILLWMKRNGYEWDALIRDAFDASVSINRLLNINPAVSNVGLGNQIASEREITLTRERRGLFLTHIQQLMDQPESYYTSNVEHLMKEENMTSFRNILLYLGSSIMCKY